MKIVLEIPSNLIQRKNAEYHSLGLLLSFFNSLDEIIHNRVKSPRSLNFFFQERLENKIDKKFMESFLSSTISLIQKEKKRYEKDQKVMLESINSEFRNEVLIPQNLQRLLNAYSNIAVSELAKVLHQSPKAGDTTKKGGESVE